MHASRRIRQRRQQLDPIGERMHHAGDLLAEFVPLPGDDDRVPGAGGGDGGPDRGPAVADLQDLGAAAAGSGRGRPAPRTGQHLRPDLRRLLGPGIVVGDDQQVGPGRGLGAHHRSLAGVPVAAGADHHDQPAGQAVPDRVQHRGQRGRFVRVVDHGHEVLTGVDPLHPAGHDHPGQRVGGLLHVPAERIDAGHRQGRVGDVERAGQGEVQGDDPIAAARAG